MQKSATEGRARDIEMWKDEEDMRREIIIHLNGKMTEYKNHIRHLRQVRRIERWELKQARKMQHMLKWNILCNELEVSIEAFLLPAISTLQKWLCKWIPRKRK